MSLSELIEQKLIQSVKVNDQIAKETLRLLKSAIKNKEIETGASLSDQEILDLIQKEIKKHLEAIEIYRSHNRAYLVEEETKEVAVLQELLPQQLTKDQLKAVVKQFIDKNNLRSANFGAIINPLKKELSGQTDGATLAAVIKEVLDSP